MLWHDYFILSDKSPSGLIWKVDIYDSRGRLTKARAGRYAGSLSGQGRWQVQLNQKVVRCHRIIYEMLHGEIPDGMVVDHADGNCSNNEVGNLVLKTHRHNGMNCKQSSSNTSGITGVSFWLCGKGKLYARAGWRDLEGRTQSKVFSVRKYGLLPSFSMACYHRDEIIEELNKQGANYTERHGKAVNE